MRIIFFAKHISNKNDNFNYSDYIVSNQFSSFTRDLNQIHL